MCDPFFLLCDPIGAPIGAPIVPQVILCDPKSCDPNAPPMCDPNFILCDPIGDPIGAPIGAPNCAPKCFHIDLPHGWEFDYFLGGVIYGGGFPLFLCF